MDALAVCLVTPADEDSNTPTCYRCVTDIVYILQLMLSDLLGDGLHSTG